MSSWFRPALLVLSLGLGCATVPQGGARTEPGLAFEVITPAEHGWLSVASNSILQSGSRIAVHVQLLEPAYVALWQEGPDGKRAPVWSLPGDAPAQRGQAINIPASGWLVLDDQGSGGDEVLYVIAARRRLTDPEIAKELRLLPGGREPPPTRDPRTKRRGEDTMVRAAFNARGVAAARFRIRHATGTTGAPAPAETSR